MPFFIIHCCVERINPVLSFRSRRDCFAPLIFSCSSHSFNDEPALDVAGDIEAVLKEDFAFHDLYFVQFNYNSIAFNNYRRNNLPEFGITQHFVDDEPLKIFLGRLVSPSEGSDFAVRTK